jgi:hypothetical protein
MESVVGPSDTDLQKRDMTDDPSLLVEVMSNPSWDFPTPPTPSQKTQLLSETVRKREREREREREVCI